MDSQFYITYTRRFIMNGKPKSANEPNIQPTQPKSKKPSEKSAQTTQPNSEQT